VQSPCCLLRAPVTPSLWEGAAEHPHGAGSPPVPRMPGVLHRILLEEQADGIAMLFLAQPEHFVKVTVTF